MARPIRLVGDIGGTNARFALAQDGACTALETVHVDDFPTLEAAIDAYLAARHGTPRPSDAALAVAGPVTGDRFAMTNHAWQFSRTELQRRFGLDRLVLLNDFTATALSLPWLGAHDLAPLCGGAGKPGTPLAVLGPGTGLGVSGLVGTGPERVPLQGEGGHVSLATQTPREDAVLAILRETFGHVSAERVLSGPGLVNLYQAVCRLEHKEAIWSLPREVQQRAADDPCSDEALDLFCGFLGTVAGDLVLTLGAWGGLYIAGGIAPRILDRLAHSAFRARFVGKGRFRPLLEEVPVAVIINPAPALLGLAKLP